MPQLRTALLALLLALLAHAAPAQDEPTDLAAINELIEAGDHGAALSRLNQRLDNNSNDIEALFLKGIVLLDRGELAPAGEIFATLSERFPQLAEAHNNLATVRVEQGRYREAREALEKAAANAPDYPLSQANLGDVYLLLAMESYRKALVLDPSNVEADAKLDYLERMTGP
ncbi:MAG: tetratricopeptide repeat protein [Candidatus Competibacterales bacterium]|nr:tetratricopeptide repeat protein [Candidatus Competibacterales bacterium]